MYQFYSKSSYVNSQNKSVKINPSKPGDSQNYTNNNLFNEQTTIAKCDIQENNYSNDTANFSAIGQFDGNVSLPDSETEEQKFPIQVIVTR